MFSIFPEILFLAPLGAVLIRAAAAAVFALSAYTHLREGRTMLWYIFGALEVAVTLSLALGFGAQMGAILGIAVAALWLYLPHTKTASTSTTLLVVAMCVSILFTGPGAFAFDLPL